MTTSGTPHPDLAAAGLPVPASLGAPATASPADSGVRTADHAAGTGVASPEFGRLEDWLGEYFLPMFRRTLGGQYRWCRQWWRHGEAISRLTALWHAWEVLRTQPGTGIGIWYREHLDHQLPVLMGARGPFYQCSEDTHREPHQAAADPVPGGWWDSGAEPAAWAVGSTGGAPDGQPGSAPAGSGDGAG